eukprot:CAMPEP_0117450668 /NCGR_PEP_ID=MMETSP0759-20121206/8592_1 /TAXON_ID=63605 /ORGANISM="Percolomonas cosmopolitus, Strain WS" /LENGTH=407 /DNA_ID=CAMNT_0005243207 /DNA_START=383 /DNA_END=1606 /DNA_ORIENTATION=-
MAITKTPVPSAGATSAQPGASVKKSKKPSSKYSNNSSSSNRESNIIEPTLSRDEQQSITYNSNGQQKTIQYTAERVIGNGSFGVVFLAKVTETGEAVAIKKVLQDRRYKNRELEIMRTVKHPNVVDMKHYFFTHGSRKELYLHLVLEYIPDTVYRYTCSYTKQTDFMPLIYVKLFSYQMLRALNYIHSIDICHRDIKPQNLLIDPVSGVLKICDFGSAKQLNPMESNVAYICSRYYRAPELIFGATHYTTSIDTWSAGCVLGEMLLGHPLFPGDSSVDQLVEIIKVLGTPTREEIDAMNKNYKTFNFPKVKAFSWDKVFQDRKIPVPTSAVDLIKELLQYDPVKRTKCIDSLAHPFFDELRDPNTRLPNGKPLPPLFNFSPNELKMSNDLDLKEKLIPEWHRRRTVA